MQTPTHLGHAHAERGVPWLSRCRRSTCELLVSATSATDPEPRHTGRSGCGAPSWAVATPQHVSSATSSVVVGSKRHDTRTERAMGAVASASRHWASASVMRCSSALVPVLEISAAVKAREST